MQLASLPKLKMLVLSGTMLPAETIARLTKIARLEKERLHGKPGDAKLTSLSRTAPPPPPSALPMAKVESGSVPRKGLAITTPAPPKKKETLAQYSVRRRTANLEVRRYLYKNLYYNPEVHEPNRRAVGMLEDLFRYYLDHPRALGEQVRKRARHDGWPRALCDYLAGMTDRYALQEHQRIFGIGR